MHSVHSIQVPYLPGIGDANCQLQHTVWLPGSGTATESH